MVDIGARLSDIEARVSTCATRIVNQLDSTKRAVPPVVGAEPLRYELQDDLRFSRPIQALLTDVVLRLRSTWIDGPAKCWGEIYPISELAVSQVDKRVSAAILEGFSNFSQFLCGLEVLLLQRQQGSTEFEEMLLGIEKLFVHGPNYFRCLGVVPEGQGLLAEADGAIDRRYSRGDRTEVHKGSPNVEKGGVGTSDSALCGDLGVGAGESSGEGKQKVTHGLPGSDPDPKDDRIPIGPTDI